MADGNGKNRELTIAFYPIQYLCNLRCTYCIYTEQGHRGIISDIEIFREIIESSTQFFDRIEVLWNGGEFLLLGKKYFEEIIRITHQWFEKGIIIKYAGQTNCTLIDDEWIAIFNRLNFRIGLSIDFPLALNECRVWPNGRKALTEIKRGIGLVIKNELKYSTTSVITKQSLGKEQKMTDELRAWFPDNITHIFSPCYMGPKNTEYMFITGAEYAEFIRNIAVLIPQQIEKVDLANQHNLCPVKNQCGKMLFIDQMGKWYDCSRTLFKKAIAHKNIIDQLTNKAENYFFKDGNCLLLDQKTRTFWKDFIKNFRTEGKEI